MKSNAVTSSTQSFGISDKTVAMRLKQKRYVALFIAGILLAILIGFLVGYFIPKSDDDDCVTPMSNQPDSPSNESGNYEAELLKILDSKEIETISR